MDISWNHKLYIIILYFLINLSFFLDLTFSAGAENRSRGEDLFADGP